MKKLITLILAVALIVCMIPATALATEGGTGIGGLTYSIFDAKIPFKNIVDCQRTTSTTVGALQQVNDFTYAYSSIENKKINELVPDVVSNPSDYYYMFIEEGTGTTGTIGLKLYKYSDSSYEYLISTGGKIQSYGDHCFIYTAQGSSKTYGSFVSFRDKAYHICETADCHKTNFEWTGDTLDTYRRDCILCGCGEAFVIQGSNPSNETLKALSKDEDDQLVQFENTATITATVPSQVSLGTVVPTDANGYAAAFDKADVPTATVTLQTTSAMEGMYRFEIEATEGVQLFAQDSAGNWYDMVKSGWGPASGFPINATVNNPTTVYIVASTPGPKTATIKLVKLGATENSVVAVKTVNTQAVVPPLGDILIAEDFGLRGEGYPGWYNVGWRYAEGFDYSTITAIEVGIQDANGTPILTYTANEGQVDWQQDTAGNGGYIYINQNRQSSAPFGKTVPAGPQEDWTAAHGTAFEGFAAEKAYVTVWVGEQSKTVNYTYSHNWAQDFTVDRAATTSAAGEKSIHCTDENCIARKEITPIAQLTPTPTPPSGGGYVSIERPDVTADDGGSYELSFLGTTLKIAAKDGYELADVTVNGVSKGAVTELKGLKTGDKVVITTKAIADEPAVEPEPEAPAVPADVQLIARSEMSSVNGKKAVKVYWYAEDGSELDFDGYDIFRSVKRYESYGKKPFFTTERAVYWNTDIEKGEKYYYKVRGYNIVDGEKVYTDWSLKAWRTVK